MIYQRIIAPQLNYKQEEKQIPTLIFFYNTSIQNKPANKQLRNKHVAVKNLATTYFSHERSIATKTTGSQHNQSSELLQQQLKNEIGKKKKSA